MIFSDIHDIQRRKNPHVRYRDLVSWVVRNKVLDLRNYIFLKFPISFALFFDENNIAATDG